MSEQPSKGPFDLPMVLQGEAEFEVIPGPGEDVPTLGQDEEQS